ncbi:MAG: hypothetical protein ACK5HU_01695 [Flavobacteriales bacterium]
MFVTKRKYEERLDDMNRNCFRCLFSKKRELEKYADWIEMKEEKKVLYKVTKEDYNKWVDKTIWSLKIKNNSLKIVELDLVTKCGFASSIKVKVYPNQKKEMNFMMSGLEDFCFRITKIYEVGNNHD